ncbi:MAG: hypothetical protein FK733_05800 [Asgard group archaeon]|nr:hypothetical protein [Asgard group archaeon]
MGVVEIIQLVSTILGMSSIVVGVFFSLLSIRRYNKSRNISLFMQYQSRTASTEFINNMLEINALQIWKSTEAFWMHYDLVKNPGALAKFVTVGTYFDSMGMLLKSKNISVEYIPEFMITQIITFWERIASIVDQLAIDMNRPESFEKIKYLYDKVQEYELVLPKE